MEIKIKLIYPVLVLPKSDNMIYVYFSDKDLKSTSGDLLTKIDYNDLEVIDSSFYRYRVRQAYRIKYLGLWGFNPLLKGRQILIDFEYHSEIQKVELESFKDEIMSRLEKKKSFWERSWSFPELKSRVYRCETINALAELLK